jgi:predicted nuclease with TOPRIM domain
VPDDTLRSTIIGGAVGAAVMVLTKVLDWAIARGKAGREEREELRAELKAVREDRDTETRRRRESEAEVDLVRERLRKAEDERDKAETALRLKDDLVNKVRSWPAERDRQIEAATAALSVEVSALLDRIAQYRDVLSERGIDDPFPPEGQPR